MLLVKTRSKGNEDFSQTRSGTVPKMKFRVKGLCFDAYVASGARL